MTASFVNLAVTFMASPAMQLFFGSVVVVKKPPSVAFMLIVSPGSVAFVQQRALVSFSTGTGRYFSEYVSLNLYTTFKSSGISISRTPDAEDLKLEHDFLSRVLIVLSFGHS